MAVSKVVYGTETLIDLTEDTVTADKLASGYTAHGADGEPIVGTAEATISGINAAQYTATFLSTGWAADANGYQSQTLTVTGLLASYDVSPDVDVSLSGTDTAGDTATLEGFSCISIVTTGADTLTAKCIGAAPSVNVPVIIRVFS